MTHKIQKFNPDGQAEILLIYDPDEHTFWANQNQMGDMYGVTKQDISHHIKAIEKQWNEKAVVKRYLTTAADGKKYNVNYYNHEMILHVGFRCQSPIARIYQRWATDVLFREIMQEKRGEERDAYRPLIRTMAMASDYSSNSDETRHAFATMQDMMHYATVGLTAAGILMGRASAQKKNMGLTTYTGKGGPTKRDVTVAKNYLTEKELEFMTKISQGFMLAIEIATTGPKKAKYTQQNLIKEFREYLIKYHQNVLESGLRVPLSDTAKRFAERQYKEYKHLLEDGLSAIQRGEYYFPDDEE